MNPPLSPSNVHIIPIPGTKRRTYLEENIGALDIQLTEDDLEQIIEMLPNGIAVGERYAEADMKKINL